MSRNKANTWLIKFNLTISPFGYSVTKHPKTDSRLKRKFGNNDKTQLTPKSRSCEALESYDHESPETQQYTMIIVCRKA